MWIWKKINIRGRKWTSSKLSASMVRRTKESTVNHKFLSSPTCTHYQRMIRRKCICQFNRNIKFQWLQSSKNWIHMADFLPFSQVGGWWGVGGGGKFWYLLRLLSCIWLYCDDDIGTPFDPTCRAGELLHRNNRSVSKVRNYWIALGSCGM